MTLPLTLPSPPRPHRLPPYGRPAPGAPSHTSLGPVRILRWPEQAHQLDQCRAQGVPRLLLVAPTAPPPHCVDQLEDWIRTPADPQDVHARQAALQVRAAPRDPVLDQHGILHFADQAVPLGQGEADLVAVLLSSYRGTVGREDLTRRMWPAGEMPRRNALDVRVLRLRRRLAPLGLVIKTVWGKGYMLDTQPDAQAANRCAPGGEWTR
ncbi:MULTISPECIES: winged helix-turn-helix domain-containing protein [unclassified Streptomyces]|uniref:Helix-turn-helix domain-containing protein n=2 Tax=unclassified Streptomyces TaxID=2593676 RepID=A0AAU2GVS7_9ACTN